MLPFELDLPRESRGREDHRRRPALRGWDINEVAAPIRNSGGHLVSTATLKAEHRDLPAADYHALTAWDSSSMLRVFERSPAEYYHKYITRRMPADTDSEAKRLGTAIHLLTLEPERVRTDLVPIPDDVLSSSGSKSGKKWSEWSAAQPLGRILVKRDEYDLMRWQLETIYANPHAASLLGKATLREHSIFWTDEQDRKLRCRIDGACELDAILFDVKRTRQTAATFWKSCRDYGYLRQAAMYVDGYRALYGVECEFYFLLVCSDPPYDCCVRSLSREAIEYGRRCNTDTLRRLHECKRGERPWCVEGYDVVSALEIPEWMLCRDEGDTDA